MYQITLTKDERNTIEAIGDRYNHGYGLYRLLWIESDPVDWFADWHDDEGPITFNVPERAAWEIAEWGREANHLWDLFGPELSQKLTDFCMQVV